MSTQAEPEDGERLLTPGEATAMFGVSARTLRNCADGGGLAAVFTAGGHRRYRVGDIRALMASGKIPGLAVEDGSEEPVRLLTAGKVGGMFRVSARTLRNCVDEGRLAVVFTPGGHRRYREGDIRALIAAGNIPLLAEDDGSEEPDRLLTPGRVEAMFRVSARALRNCVDEGRLAAVFTPGGHRRYREGDIRALIAAGNIPLMAEETRSSEAEDEGPITTARVLEVWRTKRPTAEKAARYANRRFEGLLLVDAASEARISDACARSYEKVLPLLCERFGLEPPLKAETGNRAWPRD